MLINRIVGAFTFRREVYAEVEHDTNFTGTAWLLVIVITFLAQLGQRTGDSLIRWGIAAGLGTIFEVLGFAVAVYVISWVGRTVFEAEVTFEELVRTLGLASVWRVIGVIGALAQFSGALSCVLAPALAIGAVMGVIAWFYAAKEALDLEWVQTLSTVILGVIAIIGINLVAGVILSILGLSAVVAGGILGGL